MQGAIFLDRDGVLIRSQIINGKPYPAPSLADVQILPYVAEALSLFKEHELLLIVVTNQPDVATGKTPKRVVIEINNFLLTKLALDDIYTCFHHDADHCLCRKPLPGLINSATEKYNIDLSKSFMIGDRWRDIEAGVNAGVKTIFIDYGYQEKQPIQMDYSVNDLMEAANIILGENDVRCE